MTKRTEEQAAASLDAFAGQAFARIEREGKISLLALKLYLSGYGRLVREAAAAIPAGHAKALRDGLDREDDHAQRVDDELDAINFEGCAKAIREMPLP